jgi:hypothetical protein
VPLKTFETQAISSLAFCSGLAWENAALIMIYGEAEFDPNIADGTETWKLWVYALVLLLTLTPLAAIIIHIRGDLHTKMRFEKRMYNSFVQLGCFLNFVFHFHSK